MGSPSLIIPPHVPRPNRISSSPGIVRRAVFFVAVLIAAFILDVRARPASANESAEDRTSADTNASVPQAPMPSPANAQAVAPNPTLVVGRTDPRRAGETFPLEISARDLNGGGFAVISGLTNGARLSVGTQLGDNSWWVPAADLEHVIIEPPPHFAGDMTVVVELRLADTKLSDKKSVHLEWLPVVTLDAREIATLLKRGNDLLASGDLAAAQLVLRRAAEGGSAQAAMILAGTYDPALITKMGAHGFSPNITLARQWYEKAKQLGSIEAARRLELMAIKRD